MKNTIVLLVLPAILMGYCLPAVDGLSLSEERRKFFCLGVCMSVSVSVYACVCLSVYLCLCVCVGVFVFVLGFVCVCVCLVRFFFL